MNPMSEFKKSYTKSYNIQGKEFLFRSLSTKESAEVEKEVARQSISLSDDSKFNTRKIGTPLNKFEDIQVEVSKGKDEKELVKEEISSWEDSFTTLLYLYYLEMLKEKDSKYQKETEFLNSLNK